MIKILFVCLGNICRSPAAQAIMQHFITENNLEEHISCDSAGTSAAHAGHSADLRMRHLAEKRGYSINHHSRQINDFDLIEFDYIVTMDRHNYLDVRDMAHDAQQAKKITTLCSYCTNHSISEVPDPYWGGNERGFATVLDILEDGCLGLLKKIKSKLAE